MLYGEVGRVRRVGGQRWRWAELRSMESDAWQEEAKVYRALEKKEELRKIGLVVFFVLGSAARKFENFLFCPLKVRL